MRKFIGIIQLIKHLFPTKHYDKCSGWNGGNNSKVAIKAIKSGLRLCVA